jgi:Protein of unknown function (DUF3551)
MGSKSAVRNVWLGIGVLVVVVGGLQPGEAREPRPYCFQGGRGTTGGTLDCSYYTWAQCQAMVTGGGEGCSVNPELGWRALERARGRSVGPKHPQARW